MFSLRHVFPNATLDTPSCGGSRNIGIDQTCSYSSSRLTVTFAMARSWIGSSATTAVLCAVHGNAEKNADQGDRAHEGCCVRSVITAETQQTGAARGVPLPWVLL